jgi:hypothetical protein
MAVPELVVPSHLSPEMAAWWLSAAVGLSVSRRLVLTAAAESWDRAAQARELVDRDGITLMDRFGQAKANPATVVERDQRSAFAALVRQLELPDALLGPMVLDDLRERRARRLAGEQ